MLRFWYDRSDEVDQWTLCGRLAGPWVEELRAAWQRTCARVPRAHAVINLKDVTFIDDAGERLLAEMDHAGAELLVSGVEHKHLVANLRAASAKRPASAGRHDETPASADAATTRSAAATQKSVENTEVPPLDVWNAGCATEGERPMGSLEGKHEVGRKCSRRVS